MTKENVLNLSCMRLLSPTKRLEIAGKLQSSDVAVSLLGLFDDAGFFKTSRDLKDAADLLLKCSVLDEFLIFVTQLNEKNNLILFSNLDNAILLMIKCLDFDGALKGIELLSENGLLAQTDSQLSPSASEILILILKHAHPRGAASIISGMSSAGLLDETYALASQNREYLMTYPTPHYAGLLFTFLDRVGLNSEPALAQNNLDIIMKYPAQDIVGLHNRVKERYMIASHLFSQSVFEEEAYVQVISDRTNLRDMAKDGESSIRPLTPQEERRLEKATQYYKPYIDELGGVEKCLDLLLKAVITRYNLNPIYVELGDVLLDERTGNSKKLLMRMPVDWECFNQLPLTETTRQNALRQYRANDIHTAYRFFKYLDSPGPWLSPDVKWESVADFKPLIATLWMAVRDTTQAPTDGYTIASRIDTFFMLFAEFQRAHNWDKRRTKKNLDGIEYYDDGEGDKRGCFTGFKDRAFGAVQGNVFINGLTKNLIHYELRKFIYNHFKCAIQDINSVSPHVIQSVARDDVRGGELPNRMDLSKAWTSILESGNCSPEQLFALSTLNVSKNAQQKFLKRLKNEYPDLKTSADLIQYIKTVFSLLDPRFPTHAHRFGGEVALHELLATPSINLKKERHILFGQPQSIPSPEKKAAVVVGTDTPTQHSHSAQSL